MKKEEFIEEYNTFLAETGLKAKEVIVSSGGACLMMGAREETDDLDVDVPESFYMMVKSIFPEKVNSSSMGEYIDYNSIVSIHNTLSDRAVEIDGVWCYTVEEMIKQKKRLIKMPDRASGKAERDKNDLKGLMEFKRKNKSKTFKKD